MTASVATCSTRARDSGSAGLARPAASSPRSASVPAADCRSTAAAGICPSPTCRGGRTRSRPSGACAANRPASPPPTPVVAVKLAEGPILISNIDSDEVPRLKLDAPVVLIYATHPDGYELPRFRLADQP